MIQPIHSIRLIYFFQRFHILGMLLLLLIGLPFIGTATSIVYVNASSSGTVGGVNFTESDIVAFDPNDNTWAQYFIGSEVVITEDISGFHVFATGEILLTFNKAVTVPGVGTVTPSDIVKFFPATDSFELFFDGSDVGLSDKSENIDAVAMSPNGNLIISTSGEVSASGVFGADEDLLEFTGTGGPSTSGSFAMYFDGSDVGLGDKNIKGVWVGTLNDIYLSLGDAFFVGGICGDASDILSFTGTTGTSTSGTFSLIWDGSANGYADQNVNGFSLIGANLVPPPSPGPCELIGQLESTVNSSGLPNGIKNSLTTSLKSARKSLEKGNNEAVINQLEAFINKVEDQRGEAIDEATADAWIAEAQSIIAAISTGFANRNGIVMPPSPTEQLARGFGLEQNYPNPFKTNTTIHFSLSEAVRVKLTVYDINAREVRSLISGNLSAGTYDFTWDATSNNGAAMSSGFYIYRLQVGSIIQTRKMTLLR